MTALAGVLRHDGGRCDPAVLRPMLDAAAHHGSRHALLVDGPARLGSIGPDGTEAAHGPADGTRTVFGGSLHNRDELCLLLGLDRDEPGDGALALAAYDASRDARRMRTPARRVRVDLHVHSAASWDCAVPPRQVALRCRRLGLSPVFLTDHDTIAGALELRRADPAGTVVGQEVTTTSGELIGLFLERAIEPGLAPEEAVRRIKAQGGLVYLQHPYDSGRRSMPEDAIERLAASIDLVEVFNGRSDEVANRRAEDLCEIVGAAPGAGSDAHTLEEIGAVYVEMPAFSGPRDFLAKLGGAAIVRDPRRWRMRLEAWRSAATGGR